MMTLWSGVKRKVIMGLAVVLASATAASAFGDPNDPGWPCVQRKVPELTLATTWSGEPIEPEKIDWQGDAGVQALVGQLAQRRFSLEEADKAIADFAKSAGAEKKDRLTKVFAGLFVRLNSERKDVMNGISRFAKKQEAFANALKERNADFDKMRNDPSVDFNLVTAKNDELLWDARVFDDRQKSLTFVCEVPVIIEQRLFSLGKSIVKAME